MNDTLLKRTLQVLELLSNISLKQLEYIKDKYPEIFKESYYASYGVVMKKEYPFKEAILFE